ncbi:Guanine nucleotide-binding protein G(I)/G(S)/G(O) subunit gamma-10 [Apodemus speciosus]|uniref:Guanine nucleotide-binding protein G(I)/G(S)/G(O) subunit gamma-10 n=1 Tax=Apodemus speciosus TaxID=105296 RepID=A0ABQ0ENA7_APOSI
MSSGASVSALQRLVEQLKLEAGVERIKRSLRQPQSFSSTAYRMHARTPCCSAFQREATLSGSPGPVLYCED